MTWLEAADWPEERPGDRFAALVERPGILRIPGAHRHGFSNSTNS